MLRPMLCVYVSLQVLQGLYVARLGLGSRKIGVGTTGVDISHGCESSDVADLQTILDVKHVRKRPGVDLQEPARSSHLPQAYPR
jgi:hypothetical protein